MIFGPLSEIQISQLISKLDQFKAHYTLSDSNIEVADSLVPLVEEEVVRIGALSPLEESELEHEEFLCPKCDYISEVAGSCPHDGTQMVDYSTWVAGQTVKSDSKTTIVIFAVIAVLVALGYFASGKLF